MTRIGAQENGIVGGDILASEQTVDKTYMQKDSEFL